jgi:hypothetical protein
MPDRYYRLNAHLRAQPRLPQGLTFFDSTTLGFPGVIVDAELARVVARLDGSVLLLPDLKADPSLADTARDRIVTHFEGIVADAGPGNSRWMAMAANSVWTSEEKIRWNPGFDALAFQLATQELSASGAIDPTRPVKPYVDTYTFGGSGLADGSMKLWLCMELEAT